MPVNHEKSIIEVDHVSFSYGKEEILHDVCFEVHQGDYLGLIGPNGSGKSTLIKIILGLLKPDQGAVKLFGQDLRQFTDRQKVGYVSQTATHFDPSFPVTALDVVLMGRYAGRGLLRRPTPQDEAAAEDALLKVDMLEFSDRLIGDLSGGQQQRVFIARALASQPEVIFLDEPTTGVDENTQEDFYRLLHKLNQELHLTLVVVSHDLERIAHEAMHVAFLNRTLTYHITAKEYIEERLARARGSHH